MPFLENVEIIGSCVRACKEKVVSPNSPSIASCPQYLQQEAFLKISEHALSATLPLGGKCVFQILFLLMIGHAQL